VSPERFFSDTPASKPRADFYERSPSLTLPLECAVILHESRNYPPPLLRLIFVDQVTLRSAHSLPFPQPLPLNSHTVLPISRRLLPVSTPVKPPSFLPDIYLTLPMFYFYPSHVLLLPFPCSTSTLPMFYFYPSHVLLLERFRVKEYSASRPNPSNLQPRSHTVLLPLSQAGAFTLARRVKWRRQVCFCQKLFRFYLWFHLKL
jgi:hypothetical protein